MIIQGSGGSGKSHLIKALKQELKDDLVIAAGGPYQIHSTTLVEAAIETVADVIDLSDNLSCVRDVYRLKGAIDGSGRRVLTACNTVSAIFAACLRASHVAHPVRITGLLVSATKYTAVKGKAASLFCSVSQPVEVSEGGSLWTRRGWTSSRRFCLPPLIGDVKGFLLESADAITLPPRSPSLKQVDYFVSTNVTGLYELFAATHVAWL